VIVYEAVRWATPFASRRLTTNCDRRAQVVADSSAIKNPAKKFPVDPWVPRNEMSSWPSEHVATDAGTLVVEGG